MIGLRNAEERPVLSCTGEWIEATDIPNAVLAEADGSCPQDWASRTPTVGWRRSSVAPSLQALALINGVQAQAARTLGISERSL